MSSGQASLLQQWLQHPKRTRLRRALFQVHLWSGLGLGLYIFFVSVTGSVLVYRNELYVLATDAGLGAIRLVSGLIRLHESFLLGRSGRFVNGIGALFVLLVLFTGLLMWWPGTRRWKRSLSVHRGVGWRRTVWDLHGMVGLWCFGFMLILALSGAYLCFPEQVHVLADLVEPPTAENAGRRTVDSLLYWLAFLHFGRIDGIGLVCSGPGLCDQTVKALWAFFGLAPALMFATGATMWWNRVLRRWIRQGASKPGRLKSGSSSRS